MAVGIGGAAVDTAANTAVDTRVDTTTVGAIAGTAASALVGEVAQLRRYPVKSMLGELVADAEVSRRGLARDRRLALLHRESGRIASAKNPRLWRALLMLEAVVEGPSVRITLPDGKTVHSSDADVDEVLSRFLDQPVTLTDTLPPDATLERSRPLDVLRDGVTADVDFDISRIGAGSPGGTFVDFAPLHLLTTSTLARIAELSPRAAAEPERFRPNILVRTDATDSAARDGVAAGPTAASAAPAPTAAREFPENDWFERELRIGADLRLRITARTPRCAIPTLEHGMLPRDASMLRGPAEHNRIAPLDSLGPEPCAGVYAEVLRPGRICVGDPVRLY